MFENLRENIKETNEKPSEIRDLEMKKKILEKNRMSKEETDQMSKEQIQEKIEELFGKESKEK
ncbi:MAG TPA: hypothetical protein VJ378_02025 [Candidatus Paceibacterota bacterium]|nr:hypothetical protein [Candidatus Paceibacterota bacterium]